MPIYVYKCWSCGLVDEKWYSMGEQAKYIRCKDCDDKALLTITAPNVVGTYKATWKFNHGMGFTPTSSKQIDRWCKDSGATYVGGGSYAPKPSKREDKGLDRDGISKIIRG